MTFDLAGVYVTDDRVDVLIGRDRNPGVAKYRLADLDIELARGDHEQRHVTFGGDSVEYVFKKVRQWLLDTAPHVRSIAIASYGPFESIAVADRKDSERYGRLQRTTTANRRLSGKSVVDLLRGQKSWPSRPLVTVVPDVTAAAIGELYHRHTDQGKWRKGHKDAVLVFMKVSIGLGAGVVRAGEPWYGKLHPEFGQLRVTIHSDDAGFDGTCVYHKSCLEGLAAVPGIEKRYAPATFEQLVAQPDHPCWDRQAFYIAQGCIAATSLWVPGRIVIGGRVMKVKGLFEKVRSAFAELHNTAEYKFYPEMEPREYITWDWEFDVDGIEGPGYPGTLGALCIAGIEARYAMEREKDT